MKNLKLMLVMAAGILSVILMCVFGIQSIQNKAIGLAESVETAKADIKVQEKRRVDLIYNLADCVKQYDEYESEALQGLADKMAINGNMEDVNTAIQGIVYAYPELKSNENYKTLMNELSITENLMAQYRENYNRTIERYNRYCKSFPARIFLSWMGYEPSIYERLDYEAPVDAPQDLFEE